MFQVDREAYQSHSVFADLDRYAGFYRQLAMSVYLWIPSGTSAFMNIDTYTYSSMQGTLDSIRTVLLSGRINDAYALLRKYYDSAVINIYVISYLQDELSKGTFIVGRIQDWLTGKDKMPEYKAMVAYIRKSEKLKPITDLLMADALYRCVRDRCNDHTHYKFYRHIMLNNNEVEIRNRIELLDQFKNDVRDLFVLHLAYVFFLHDHYMMSSDYRDALDCGAQPVEGSQYWVAPFVQIIFDEVVTVQRPEITAVIKNCSAMQLG